MTIIETSKLTKTYGNYTAVDHVDLSVNSGEIFGFLGKNGAGKSTFINMMTGIIRPTSGTIKLFGNEAHAAHQRKLGVLPDYSTLYDDMTALQHLQFFGKILGVKKSKEEYASILERVALQDAIDTKAKKFSFGMKKKLGIAQALVNDPKLLILDEPTSGIDANAVLTIHDLIREEAARGTTVFLTSHNLDEVEKLCDQIAIMNKGTIQAKGNMASLRHNYQQDTSITIKHSEINEQDRKAIEHILQPIANKIEWSEKSTSILLDTEAHIPEVHRTFATKNVDIYRFDVFEASLEDIFKDFGREAS
ncbi:ATP-binding cassette domain-containing protein [Alkalihalobacillus sp. R86527]|uniref:ABC transporter ATP-binding protein n=1 Tax=Alkalihalobacillus sp. R86527 TaxID=3093863 RepID=UPI00366ED101